MAALLRYVRSVGLTGFEVVREPVVPYPCTQSNGLPHTEQSQHQSTNTAPYCVSIARRPPSSQQQSGPPPAPPGPTPPLPPGVVLLKGWLSLEQQIEVVNTCRCG